MEITVKDFGQGEKMYSLTNDHGVTLDVTTLGARIVHLFVPTETGKKNIVLGFDSAEEYLEKDTYIGATIGRVAGRISNGALTIDDQAYSLVQNTPQGHTLHGGPDSFEVKSWQAETKVTPEAVSVIFTTDSPAGENGFPGNLKVSVTYTLTNENEWILSYQGTTDQKTVYNPTNHVYFNLTGDITETIGEHSLMVAADKFAVVTEGTVVTGEQRPVDKTPFDFRKPTKIAQIFGTDYEQNVLVDGLDHPFLLSKPSLAEPQAQLISPDEEITVEVYTDRSAIVIFTAQFDAPIVMHDAELAKYGGITFETQISPGAVEFADFGTIDLAPTETFSSQTVYKINLK